MNIFRTLALVASLLTAAGACAQKAWQTQGVVEGNLPASWQTLKAQMRYPASWLAGNEKDFNRWRSHSRQLLRSALLTPDSHTPFTPQKIAAVTAPTK